MFGCSPSSRDLSPGPRVGSERRTVSGRGPPAVRAGPPRMEDASTGRWRRRTRRRRPLRSVPSSCFFARSASSLLVIVTNPKARRD